MADPLGLVAKSSNWLRITLNETKTGNITSTGTVVVTLTDALGVVQLSNQTVAYTGAGGVWEYLAAPTAFPVPGTYTATWHAVDGAGRVLDRTEPILVVL